MNIRRPANTGNLYVALGCALFASTVYARSGANVMANVATPASGPAAAHLSAPPAAVSPRAAAPQTPAPRSLVNQYCVACHNSTQKVAGLALEHLDAENVGADAETWEKVLLKLRAGAMPPRGRPRPDAAVGQAFISRLATSIDAAAAKAPNPGRPAIHRLNRVEYTNAVRDLLALDIDGPSLLPADDSGYGFDNIADVLSVSPGLLERYMTAAKKISRWAVGDPTIRPALKVYTVPYMTLLQEDRMSEQLPFGSRGGVSVSHYFPLDGEYQFKIRLQRNQLNIGNVVRGLDVPNQIDVRVDGARVKLFTLDVRDYDSPGNQGYRDTEDTADAHLEVRVPVAAGTHVVGVTFPKRTWYFEGVGMSRLPAASDGYASGVRSEEKFGKIEAGIDRLDIVGPFNGTVPAASPSRQHIFVCQPTSAESEEPCAKKIIATIAHRAFRRPIRDDDVQSLLGFYNQGRTNGSFDRGIQFAITRILADPDFLFRIEYDAANVPPGTVHRLNDLDLASRLSFFLWSSVPDDELLDLAERGRLKSPAVVEAQVRRMLADPRSKSLLDNFFGQWLYVRNMSSVRPDPKAFIEFDDSLRENFKRETEMFLDSQLREDRSVLDLLTANYTFVNERLARHYDIPNVYGSHFRRVTYPDDRRAGLLGQGTILTVTSYANRTSPVVRGKWLLENLLGTPPPPPPDDVPTLEEDGTAPRAKSVRERMEQHRKNPACASCHTYMDPIGFALENFDGVGKWRSDDGDRPVDSSGMLTNGHSFNGPAEFRKALLHSQDLFIETLTTKLLTYALGRGAEYYDMPAVRRIVREAAAEDYRWSSIILGITRSLPFEMRRTR